MTRRQLSYHFPPLGQHAGVHPGSQTKATSSCAALQTTSAGLQHAALFAAMQWTADPSSQAVHLEATHDTASWFTARGLQRLLVMRVADGVARAQASRAKVRRAACKVGGWEVGGQRAGKCQPETAGTSTGEVRLLH